MRAPKHCRERAAGAARRHAQCTDGVVRIALEESMKLHRIGVLAMAGLTVIACDDDDGPTEPRLDRADVAGVYTLTTFTFDPQGSLPAVDIKAGLGTTIPSQMIVTADGRLQFLVQDAQSGLTITASGDYETTSSGIRIEFDDNGRYEDLLMSQRMELEFSETAGTLSFSGAAPDGVPRARLLAFAPQLQDEQLLDPTPGTMELTLTRVPG
jgi:hypothetical protein